MNQEAAITVLAAHPPSADPEEACRLLSPLLEMLSPDQRRSILANRRPLDRALRLLVRALLALGLKMRSGPEPGEALAALEFDEKGRPCSRFAEVSFSHSRFYGVCALAPPGGTGGLGVDVEAVQPLALDDFRHVFSTEEMAAIRTAARPDRELIRRWTVKEAVLKASGQGFAGDPLPILTDRRVEGLVQGGGLWRHLHLDEDYFLTVAAGGNRGFQARLGRPEASEYLSLWA